MSSTEEEYVALFASCAQVMWMRTQLNTPVPSTSILDTTLSRNRLNVVYELYFVRTEYQLAYMFMKALPQDRFEYLVRRISMRCLTPAELEVLANETA
ncbi:hypothetical protein Tco_1512525 [Tanacetum coccineum]